MDVALIGRDRVESIIHEGIHAGLWVLKEEVVDTLAADITAWLVREGLAPKD